jgi:hypothetical protein
VRGERSRASSTHCRTRRARRRRSSSQSNAPGRETCCRAAAARRRVDDRARPEAEHEVERCDERVERRVGAAPQPPRRDDAEERDQQDERVARLRDLCDQRLPGQRPTEDGAEAGVADRSCRTDSRATSMEGSGCTASGSSGAASPRARTGRTARRSRVSRVRTVQSTRNVMT